MVSFQCDGCADTVKKPKLDQHRSRCHASFTCLGTRNTSHTSCISEAEKYQGALYKGAKKGKSFQHPDPVANDTPKTNPVETQIPAESSTSPSTPLGTSSIHPSRLQALESGPSNTQNSSNNYNSRGGFGGRGRGRGGMQGSAFGNRGGFNNSSRGGSGFGSNSNNGDYVKFAATAENRLTASGGMRSWGSTPNNGTPVPEQISPIEKKDPISTYGNSEKSITPVNGISSSSTVTATISNHTNDDVEKKKKKKKGDKGGTGAKANSKHPKSETADTIAQAGQSEPNGIAKSTEGEPVAKKRKREDGQIEETSTSIEVSEKIMKRIRKNLSKLDPSGGQDGFPLSSWLEKMSQGKKGKEGLSTEQILGGLKVSNEGGKWVLSA